MSRHLLLTALSNTILVFRTSCSISMQQFECTDGCPLEADNAFLRRIPFPHFPIFLQYIILKHMSTVPAVVGVGKEEHTLIGPWGYLNRQLPFIELP